MKKTYRGSCHCGAVQYEADCDLTTETSRCNCSICTKTRLWKIVVAPGDVRMLRGEDALADYRFSRCVIEHVFCRTCGVKPFGRGELDGKQFVAINVAALDDATDIELAQAPIIYQDGRNDAWSRRPLETRYL